ncbi:MAG TPA: uroporphyrinogen decarboxylase family protein, partial [bacterium]|nr:uroporphyrinogen decarboxylase family protein [bacterium]
MKSDLMTPKERWTAVLKMEKPDRVPLFWTATPETTANIKKYLRISDNEELFTILHIDKVVYAYPAYAGPNLPKDTDIFACRCKNVSYGSGVYAECVYHPLAQYKTIEEVKKNYKFPTIDWFDFSNIKKQIQNKENLPIYGGGMEIFLIYANLRGREKAMIDLVENPEMVDWCLENIFQLYYKITMGVYDEIPGKVLLTGVSEDLGSQDNLLFSPACIRKFILPRMKKMMRLVHENNAYVMTHSDGAIRDIIPDLIECGMNMLDPVQWRCKGMEREALKRDFGNK